jgi:hypothetical protein
VIVSLLAVLFSVPGTVWAVLVAQDQLHQSKEAEAKEERAQASRVSAWTSLDARDEWVIHVMNRSPDPIAPVELRFTLSTPASSVLSGVYLASVPPCTDQTITQKQLIYYPDQLEPGTDVGLDRPARTMPSPKEGWRRVPREGTYNLFLDGVVFGDRNGSRWVRNDGTLNRWHDGLVTLQAGRGVFKYRGRVVGQPKDHTIKECGEDGAR